MKKNRVSIITIALNLIVLLLLITSFFLQYGDFFVTRIVAIVFAVVYLVIEIKKSIFRKIKYYLLL